MARRLGLGQDDVPGLPAHRGPELGVMASMSSRAAGTCRPRSVELDPGLGKPSSQVGDEIGDRPVGVAVVAGPDDVGRIERSDQLEQLVPSGPLGLDLGVERVPVRGGRSRQARNRHLAIDGSGHRCGPQAEMGWRCET